MNNKIAWILLVSLGTQLVLPIAEGLALTPQASKTMLLAEKGNRGGNRGGGGGNRGGGGGNRGGGNRAERSGGNLNRSSVGGQGSGRVQRDTANRPSRSSETRSVNRENVNRSGDRQTSNRIERPQTQIRNIDHNQTRDRVNNNRDVNVNRDRNVNVDRNRTVNVDRNRNVVESSWWGGLGLESRRCLGSPNELLGWRFLGAVCRWGRRSGHDQRDR